jgi:hypothetical protein
MADYHEQRSMTSESGDGMRGAGSVFHGRRGREKGDFDEK